MFLLLSGGALAETRQVSLREAIELAVQLNPALAVAGAEVTRAAALTFAARGLDDPMLAATLRASSTRRRWVPGELQQDRVVDELAATISLEQPLPAGGRLELGLQGGHERALHESDPPAGERSRSISTRYTPAVQLSLEQPLLRGAGVEVARADRGRASIAHDLARAEHEVSTAALLRDVTDGYWRLAHAQGALTIRRGSLSAAHEQLGRVQANIAVGKLPYSATAEIEVAIGLRQDAVLGAEQDVIEREVALGRLCGMTAGQRLSGTEQLPALATRTRAALDAPATLTRALARSPRLAAVRAQGRAGALELRLTEGALLPQLDLALAGGPIGDAPSARAAFDEITGLASFTVMAHLALELPLGGHAARGALEAARARRRQTELTEADVHAQLAAAVARYIAALETAWRRSDSLAPALVAATLDLEAEKARFESGRSSSFEVLRRQDALAAVQLVQLSARLMAIEASTALAELTGHVLQPDGSSRLRGGS